MVKNWIVCVSSFEFMADSTRYLFSPTSVSFILIAFTSSNNLLSYLMLFGIISSVSYLSFISSSRRHQILEILICTSNERYELLQHYDKLHHLYEEHIARVEEKIDGFKEQAV